MPVRSKSPPPSRAPASAGQASARNEARAAPTVTRRALFGLGLALAPAVAASGVGRGGEGERPRDGDPPTYRLSEHVRRYYDAARY